MLFGVIWIFSVVLLVPEWTSAAGRPLAKAWGRDSYCGWGWTATNSSCIYQSYYKKLTIEGSRDYCNTKGGSLVTVKNAAKLATLQSYIYGHYGLSWVDMYRRTDVQKPGWYWGDGTPFKTGVLNWFSGPGNIIASMCAGVSTQSTFSPRSCRNSNGFACQATRDYKKGCPAKFHEYFGICIFLSDLSDVTQLGSKYWAQRQCLSLANGSSLVQVDTYSKNNALNKFIGERTASNWLWWTDLATTYRGNDWSWGNANKPVGKFVKWAQEPDNLADSENCVAMYLNTGMLVDLPCVAYKASFMCQKPDIIPDFSPFTGKFGCGKYGWMRGGKSCYFLRNGKSQKWEDARKDCQKAGGDLLKIDDKMEMMWLSKVVSFAYGWTGLCFKGGAWKWADGTKADPKLLKWEKEPMSHAHGSCATLDRDGVFISQVCTTINRYICEVRVKGHWGCPQDWSYFNKSCYIVNNTAQANWREAKFECRQISHKWRTYLYVPSYQGEVDFVRTLLPPKAKMPWMDRFWTGLTDGNTGVWGIEVTAGGGWHHTLDLEHLNWKKSPIAGLSDKQREGNWKKSPIPGLSDKQREGYCASMFHSGALIDEPKNLSMQPICERGLGDGPNPSPLGVGVRKGATWGVVVMLAVIGVVFRGF